MDCPPALQAHSWWAALLDFTVGCPLNSIIELSSLYMELGLVADLAHKKALMLASVETLYGTQCYITALP